MPSLNEKIAADLQALHDLTSGKAPIVRSDQLGRVTLKRLTDHGYLEPIMPGWFVETDPKAQRGTSTPYYAAFWSFLSLYNDARFGRDWVVDPGSSILMHVGNYTVPRQVMIWTPKGNNQSLDLPFNTSMFFYRKSLPQIERKDGVNVMPLGEALVHVPANFFVANPSDAAAALASIGSGAEVAAVLIRGGHAVIAGRLAAAFRSVGRTQVANELVEAMISAGHEIREPANVFAESAQLPTFKRRTSPVSARTTALWESMRADAIAAFDHPLGEITDTAGYLSDIDGRFTTDAYHSLSIEGYRVTPALIARVASGEWNPEESDSDNDHRNALAAKGYAESFKSVRTAIGDILNGADASEIVQTRHLRWFRELFQPSVAAGIIAPDRLAGYRSHFVYLKGSRYVPVAYQSIPDAMDAYFECLEKESDPRVRALLGHFIFTFIHPLPDGNGRLGRFIMNAMLASAGLPWTVVPLDERDRYMQALDAASLQFDIKPFAALIGDLVKREPPPPRLRAKGEEPAYREEEPQPSP